MNASYTLWTRRDKAFCGKITLCPTDDHEAAALKIFKIHAGIDQSGKKLDIIYRWRPEVLQAVKEKEKNAKTTAGSNRTGGS